MRWSNGFEIRPPTPYGLLVSQLQEEQAWITWEGSAFVQQYTPAGTYRYHKVTGKFNYSFPPSGSREIHNIRMRWAEQPDNVELTKEHREALK